MSRAKGEEVGIRKNQNEHFPQVPDFSAAVRLKSDQINLKKTT